MRLPRPPMKRRSPRNDGQNCARKRNEYFLRCQRSNLKQSFALPVRSPTCLPAGRSWKSEVQVKTSQLFWWVVLLVDFRLLPWTYFLKIIFYSHPKFRYQ